MTQGWREDKCPSVRTGKDRAPVGAERAALTRRPFHYADVLMGLLSFQTCHLSVTDDVVVPALLLLLLLFFSCRSDY